MTKLGPGSRVQVRDDWPEARGPAHVRTPHYVRGREGIFIRDLGVFEDPEALAFARPASPRRLYHVGFRARDVWPDTAANDEIVVEIYEHWLEDRP